MTVMNMYYSSAANCTGSSSTTSYTPGACTGSGTTWISYTVVSASDVAWYANTKYGDAACSDTTNSKYDGPTFAIGGVCQNILGAASQKYTPVVGGLLTYTAWTSTDCSGDNAGSKGYTEGYCNNLNSGYYSVYNFQGKTCGGAECNSAMSSASFSLAIPTLAIIIATVGAWFSN